MKEKTVQISYVTNDMGKLNTPFISAKSSYRVMHPSKYLQDIVIQMWRSLFVRSSQKKILNVLLIHTTTTTSMTRIAQQEEEEEKRTGRGGEEGGLETPFAQYERK